MKTLLIEDEENARQALKKLLRLTVPSIQVVGETGYIKEASNLIHTQKPDLIFLDIELEDGLGIDWLQSINHPKFKVIFTTAYNQYAIKAFKFSAIDYLLKPINPEELRDAVQRAISSIKNEKEYMKLLSTLKSNFKEKRKENSIENH